MSKRDDVVAFLRAQVGKPYVWGEAGPDGFDCSGLMQDAYKTAAGIDIGRDTAAQQQTGREVSAAEALPGDGVFFGDLAGPHAHVGGLIGSDSMIDAPHSGAEVRVDHISAWADSGEPLRQYRRWLEDVPAPAPAGSGSLDPLWEVFVSIAKDDNDARRFTVRMIYATFGHREPDVAGLDHWAQSIATDGLDATLSHILDSPEFTADQQREQAGG